MNINLMCPINQLGYGIAGLNIFKSLSKLCDVSLWTIGSPEITTQEDYDIVLGGVKKSALWDNNAPCIKIWHQHDMAQFAGKGKRIGFPFFELDKFSNQEKHNLNSLDKIFVTSKWAKDIILNETQIADINVIPLGVDTTIFKPSNHTYTEKTVFFNCGKWEIRKGHDVLVDLFNKAFNEDDNVELWMMCSNPFLKKEELEAWEKLYLKSRLGQKIKIIPRVRTQKEVYNIIEKIDCGIFPSRAEGWNLELLECMACGKQVIATNYSAHQEFCNNKNSYLVNIEETEIAYDGKWFYGKSGNWAKISSYQEECFIEQMRKVHKSKAINIAGIETAKNFTWNESAKKIVNNV